MEHPVARCLSLVKPVFDFYCQVTEEQKEDGGRHGEGEKNWCVLEMRVMYLVFRGENPVIKVTQSGNCDEDPGGLN